MANNGNQNDNSSISTLISKLLFPGLIVILGIVMVVIAHTASTVEQTQQTPFFKYGAYALLLVGILTVMYVLELIPRKVHIAMAAVLFIFTGVLCFYSYKSLSFTIKEKEKVDLYNKYNQQKMEDLRTVQKEYKKTYGRYAPSLDSLDYFLNYAKLMRVEKDFSVGPYETIPDRQPNAEECAILGYDPLNDDDLKKIEDGIDLEEALLLGIVRLDTTYVPVLPELFDLDPNSKKNIDRDYIFDPATFTDVYIVDESDEARKFGYRYRIERDTIEVINEDVEPADTTYDYRIKTFFQVYDELPFDPFSAKNKSKDTLKFGDMEEGGIDGSWEG